MKSLAELLEERKKLINVGITFIQRNDQEYFLSYKDLYDEAFQTLSFLQLKGLKQGDELVFQIEENKDFIICFWACILGGIIPVPLTVGHTNDHKQKLFNVFSILKKPHLIISSSHLKKIKSFATNNDLGVKYEMVCSKAIKADETRNSEHPPLLFNAQRDDLAYIQFSSGSTGSPKGVCLTHRNLLVNIKAISKAVKYSPSDRMLSWMPLTHDMGLIGLHLNPLYIGMPQFLIPTNLFIRRPSLWLEKASVHQVTILGSPNFGYSYLLKHTNLDEQEWNLSQVRLIYNGAEPISDKLSANFTNSLAKFGLKRQAICPVYGLAEATLAVSISDLMDEVHSVHIERSKLQTGSKVFISTENDNTISFVNVGKGINDCSIRIVSDAGHPVEDEVIGHIQIKGDNVTSGYYNDVNATEKVKTKDGWLSTGDLGFIKEKSLFVTGRAKDIFFVNGQNYYPHDIERIVEGVSGVELNKVAIGSVFSEESQKEEVIAFVFHRGSLDKFVPTVKAIVSHINAQTGIKLDRVLPVNDIPRTTSGKLQRFKLLEYFRQGEYKEVEQELNRLAQELTANKLSVAKPENEYEQKLLDIWKKVLKSEEVGVEQKFFEIGGNSLKAAEIGMMLLQELQVELPFETVYEKQTIRELAEEISSLGKWEYVPIPKAPEAVDYPVSSSQRRLYYAWEADKCSLAYNTPVAFKIQGKLDSQKLEGLIKQLTDRHDSLRMYFKVTSEPRLLIEETVDFALKCTKCNRDNLNKKLRDLVVPFDLQQGSLFRIELLKLKNHEYILFLDFHHIVSDGLSITNFIDELFKLYSGDALQKLPIGFKDYSSWENENLQAEKLKGQKDYWLNYLQKPLPVLEMPIDFARSALFYAEGEKLEFELDTTVSEQLRSLAKAHDCTMHVLLFTVYHLLLSVYTGQDDIVIGIPVAGRRHPDLLNIQGMFVNNLAIRNTLHGNESFIQLLERVKKNLVGALNNQDYPFEQLVKEINQQRDPSRNPIFDTMFVYQNMGFPEITNSDFTFSRHFFDPGFSKFDISLEVYDHARALKCYIEYGTKLFRKETIVEIVENLNNLIKKVIDKPELKLKELGILSDRKYDEYVRKFNSTVSNYPKDKTVHQLFEEQVKKFGSNAALEFNGRIVTYQELNDSANKVALLLRAKGITAGKIVGILLERSPEFIISILGVLKAGGSFLPIDSDLPEQRILYIINDSKCDLLITAKQDQTRTRNLLLKSAASVANIDELDFDSKLKEAIPNVNNVNTSQDLSYVIYTSGTTGGPKGVMVEHRSLVNYITWAAENYIKEDEAAFPLFTSVSFDLTITSIFTPLLTGNKIVIYGDKQEVSIEKVFSESKAKVVKLTPSHLKVALENRLLTTASKNSIKRFIVGGEALESTLAMEIYDEFGGMVEVYNEYGPTEATIGCMIHKFAPEEALGTVPIGVPIQNTQIFILDKFLRPVPMGVKGELYIAGDGLARGYLFNKELSNQKFIANPFAEGQRMYRTGDIALRLSNGLIDFVGRADQQIKINGYRIELAEIEYHLRGHAEISEALVCLKKNLLCAYYISAGKTSYTVKEPELRNYLAGRIPYYMIPARFFKLEEIPLTSSGKVNYDALPEPNSNMKGDFLPKNEVEKHMVEVWKAVLNESYLSTTDSFFELGGDSIKAVQIASKLAAKGIIVDVKDILTYVTIEQISLCVKGISREGNYEQGFVQGEIKFTPIISWFFSNRLSKPAYFMQSVVLELDEKIANKKLEKAFEAVIKHHDTLRLNYDIRTNKLYYNEKHINQSFEIKIHEVNESDEISTTCIRIREGWDLAEDLLVKAAVFREAGKRTKLFITAHHLVTDGVSWRILLEDLFIAYHQINDNKPVKLFQKTAPFMLWANKMNELASSCTFQEELEYWKKTEETEFKIPLDVDTQSWKVKSRKSVKKIIGVEDTHYLLKDANKAFNTDILILLHAVLILTLKEWCDTDVIIIEEEHHGRHFAEIDVSRTIGWFTAMYPVRFETPDNRSLTNLIKSVKESIRRVPNKGLGYGLLKYTTDPSMLPIEDSLTEIRFNYLGQFGSELASDHYNYSSASSGSDVSPENPLTTKLELQSMIMDGALRIEILYNSQAHHKQTMEWFADKLMTNIYLIKEHIQKEKDIHFTPSDFEGADLDEEELDLLFE